MGERTTLKRMRVLRMAIAAGAFWTLALPSVVLAQAQKDQDVLGHECEQGQVTNNPHCVVPEVPIAAVYPVLGAATFGLALAYRARRRLTHR